MISLRILNLEANLRKEMITVMIPKTRKKPVQKEHSKTKRNLQLNRQRKVANLQERRKHKLLEKELDNYLKTFSLLIFFGSILQPKQEL